MMLNDLKKKNFEEILENYNIGKYKKSKHVWWAFSNYVYIIVTSKSKYILKIFDSDKRFVKYQVKIMDYIYSKKIPVAKIIKSKDKNEILIYNKKPMIIQEFIKGRHPKNLNKKEIKECGKILAKLFIELKKLGIKNKFNWKKDFQFSKLWWEVTRIENFDVDKEIKEIVNGLKKVNKKRMKKSLIHGDFHSVNLLIKKNKIKAIIDWDNMHEDFIIQDVAVFITHSFIKEKRIEKIKIKLFLNELDKYLHLNKEEKIALYYFIKRRIIGAMSWSWEHRKKQKNSRHKKALTYNIKELINKYHQFNKLKLNEFLSLFEK